MTTDREYTPDDEKDSGTNGQGTDSTPLTIEEYEQVKCGQCGGTEKTLDVVTCSDGRSQVVLYCRHCRLGNLYKGSVDTSCLGGIER